MKRCLYICILCSLLLGRAGVGYSQDYSRLGERTILGTARYMGIGGAMTAIGGDPSAVLDNPAGLGLYRRLEVLFTPGIAFGGNNHLSSPYKTAGNGFLFPQTSIVITLPTYRTDGKGVLFHNLMFSYQRMHSFNRALETNAEDRTSLGYLFSQTGVDLGIPYCKDTKNSFNKLLLQERGYVDQYSFHWAMNISDRWYVGLGLQIQSYLLSSDADYQEWFAGKNDYNNNITSVILSGTSFNMALGVLYRPIKWLRLGASLQLPSVGSLNTSTYGRLEAQTDSLRFSYAPDLKYSDKSFHMPWHLSTSVAFQIGAYALIAAQYDYTTASYMQSVHSLRAGLEVVPVMGMYINAGYVFEMNSHLYASPTKVDPSLDRQDAYSVFPRSSQYASAAIGYRGTYTIVQLAYQYHLQQPLLYAHEYTAQYDNVAFKNNRIVMTIGWHLP